MKGIVMLEIEGRIVKSGHFTNKKVFKERVSKLLKQFGNPSNYTLTIRPDDEETNGQDIVQPGRGDLYSGDDSISVAL